MAAAPELLESDVSISNLQRVKEAKGYDIDHAEAFTQRPLALLVR